MSEAKLSSIHKVKVGVITYAVEEVKVARLFFQLVN
jgi:hypothetical protein